MTIVGSFRMLRWLFRELGIFAWAFLALVLFGIISVSRENSVSAQCLALGYPDAHVTWAFVGYCSRRVNNTDEVLRLR